VSKTWSFGVGILSAILAIVSVTLAIILFRQQRFTLVNGNNPYIMFDNRTAQACWSGAPITPTPEEHTSESFGRIVGSARVKNPNDLPFCKDLK
jgi:hypothetical protein